MSRGELVEIGGSFRLPDVMEKSGAKLVEVGTTNRTRIEDYEAAITRDTAAILKVHHSNFAMTGFVESPSLRDLATWPTRHSIALIEDLEAARLPTSRRSGLPREPMPQESIADGVDVVTFSGDKLLGGPQAGVIAGRRGLVGAMKSNPLARALRLDKMTLAALEETLRLYLEAAEAGRRGFRRCPRSRCLAAPGDGSSGGGARKVAEVDRRPRPGRGLAGGFTVDARTTSQVGGGSLPLADIESFAVVHGLLASVSPDAPGEARLRKCEIPVIARIGDDKVYIDFRTIPARDDDLLIGRS